MMMNKKRSAKLQLSKYAFMLPVIVFSAAAFTLNHAEAKIVDVVEGSKEISLTPFLVDESLPLEVNSNTQSAIQDTVKGKVVGLQFVSPNDLSLNSNNAKMTLTYTIDSIQKVDPPKPLILVNGKEFDDINNIDPNSIENITVLKDKAAFDLYGEKGKDGAILVTTKSGGATFSVNSISSGNEYKHTAKGFINAKGNKIGLILLEGKEVSMDEVNKVPEDKLSVKSIYTGEKAIQLYGEKGKNGVVELRDRRVTIAIQDTSKRIIIGQKDPTGKQPLVILDGEIYNGNIHKTNPNSIENMTVVKGTYARKLFGEKAAGGIIILTTKNKTTKENAELSGKIKKLIEREVDKERGRQDSILESKATRLDAVTVIGFQKPK